MKMTGLLKRTVSVLVVFSFLNAQVAYSLPQDVEVVEGAADVNIEGATMTINADAGTILNYSSFDLAEGESVIINLPGIDADILNRVIGAGASNIAGAISCNGLFILVNTSGIYLASTANIDVGSLVLSTRDITNSDFVNGKYFFQKISEEALDTLLKNAGTINVREGGFGVLIAGAIENSGMIVAPMGRIHLAAGDAVTLALSSDGLISVAIDEKVASTIHDMDGNPITDQITNTGSIIADGGVVAISAESLTDIFRNAINLDGIVQADTMSSTAGEISITSSSDITLGGGISAVGGMIGVISEEGSIRAEETSEMTAQDVYVEAQRDISLEGTIETMEGGLVDLHALNGSMYSHGSIIAPEGEINVCAAYDLDLGGFYKASRMVFDPEEVNITSDWTGSGDTTFWATGNINVQANMTLEEGSFYFYADSTDASGTYDDGSGTFTQSSSSTITADYDISIDGSGSVSVGGIVSTSGSLYVGNVTGDHTNSYVAVVSDLNVAEDISLSSSGGIGVYTGNTLQANNMDINADMDGNGTGSFSMFSGTALTLTGGDLSISAGENSTLEDISGVDLFTIGSTTAAGISFTCDAANTFSVDTFKTLGDGSTTFVRAVGDGTSIPRMVYDITQLQAMQDNLSWDYQLANNIDASATAGWNSGEGFVPVGDDVSKFTGTFDGGGKVVSGLFVDTTQSYTGLFGYVSGATLSDVGLEDISITATVSTGYAYVGGLSGYAQDTLVTNVYTTGSVDAIRPGGVAFGGGLIGCNEASALGQEANITSSYSLADVSVNAHSGYAGGLIAQNSANGGGSADIADCYATGSVSMTASSFYAMAGGLVGQNVAYAFEGGPSLPCANITGSYATGEVQASSGGTGDVCAGGLIGYNTTTEDNALITDSYATGNATASGGTSTYAGGLIAYNDAISNGDATITRSYATGDASATGAGTTYAGGLVGYMDAAIMSTADAVDSFALGTATATGGSTNYVGGLGGYIDIDRDVSTSRWYNASNTDGVGSLADGDTLKEIAEYFTDGSSEIYTNWDFTVDGTGAGSGTWIMAGLPHLQMEWTDTITTLEELQMILLDYDVSYTLANDIDAAATTGWNWNSTRGVYEGFKPLTLFSATFDGSGYEISGLNIDRTDTNIGMFGVVFASTIQDLSLSSASITHSDAVSSYNLGGVAGLAYSAYLNDISFSGTVSGSTSSGDAFIGGLTGYMNAGGVSGISTAGTVTGASSLGKCYVGGVIGQLYTSAAGTIEVTLSDSSADVSADSVGGYNFVGGLIGSIELADFNLGSVCNVTDSYATGDVSGNTTFTHVLAGGLIGRLYIAYNADVNVEDCYATGDVSATGTQQARAGGLMGQFSSNGAESYVTMNNCYATGDVTAVAGLTDEYPAMAGGLIGLVRADADGTTIINNSFATGTASATGARPRECGLVGWDAGGEYNDCLWFNSTNIQGMYFETPDSYDGTALKAASLPDLFDADSDLFSTWDLTADGTGGQWVIQSRAAPPDFYREYNVWTGGGTTNNWSDAANWSALAAPSIFSKVLLSSVSTKSVTWDSDITVAKMHIDASYTGQLTQGDGYELTATDVYYQGGGTVRTSGTDLSVEGGTFVQDGGSITLASGGDIYLDSAGYMELYDVSCGDESTIYLGSREAPSSVVVTGTISTLYPGGSQSGLEIYSDGGISVEGAVGGSTYYFDSIHLYLDHDDNSALSNIHGSFYADLVYVLAQNNIVVDGTLANDAGALYVGQPGYTPDSITQDGRVRAATYVGMYANVDINMYDELSSNASMWIMADYDDNGSGAFRQVSGSIVSYGDLSIDGSGEMVLGYVYLGDSADMTIGEYRTPDIVTIDIGVGGAAGGGDISIYSNGDINLGGDIGSGSTVFNNVRFYPDYDSNAGMSTVGGNVYADYFYIETDSPLSLTETNVYGGGLYVGALGRAPISVSTLEPLYGFYDIDIYSDGDILIGDDIYGYEVELFADYDGNGTGSFTQTGGIIESYGDIVIDGVGDMDLGAITINDGSDIIIGSSRKPSSVTLNGVITGINDPYLEICTSGNILQNADIGAEGLAFGSVRFYMDDDMANGYGGFIANSGTIYADNVVLEAPGDMELGGISVYGGDLWTYGDHIPSSLTLTGDVSVGYGDIYISTLGSYDQSSSVVSTTGSGSISITSTGTSYLNDINGAEGILLLANSGQSAVYNASDSMFNITGGIGISSNVTLNGQSSDIRLSGAWTNSGIFNAGTSIVTFNGAGTGAIYGSNTFYDLKCVTPGKTLRFAAGRTQVVSGALTLGGTEANKVILSSTSDGTQWHIDARGSMSIANVSVKDSFNDKGLYIDPAGSIDRGGNSYWFTPSVPQDDPVDNDNNVPGEGSETLDETVLLDEAPGDNDIGDQDMGDVVNTGQETSGDETSIENAGDDMAGETGGEEDDPEPTVMAASTSVEDGSSDGGTSTDGSTDEDNDENSGGTDDGSDDISDEDAGGTIVDDGEDEEGDSGSKKKKSSGNAQKLSVSGEEEDDAEGASAGTGVGSEEDKENKKEKTERGPMDRQNVIDALSARGFTWNPSTGTFEKGFQPGEYHTKVFVFEGEVLVNTFKGVALDPSNLTILTNGQHISIGGVFDGEKELLAGDDGVEIRGQLPELGGEDGELSDIVGRTGKITAISGKVDIIKKAGQENVSAQIGMTLEEGDVLVTDTDSEATIELAGKKGKTAAEVDLSENTQIMVDELSLVPDKGTEDTLLDIAVGKILVKVESLKDSGGSTFEIQTPTSIVAVRGTVFTVEVSPSKE
ncbi:MAG: filamentous hemagglutinin N-terminal domain-containing protein [Candidatus Omnitrophica bacterium]|nr:filamentous hemagglutinin N-terminal domain-containing protein [Candidatus Omnitrophota bacterium]MDD5487984.1 filamentous hemagglutinin N-terminal domain-containing protein [Candidatus Omnitrophota bacterium]